MTDPKRQSGEQNEVQELIQNLEDEVAFLKGEGGPEDRMGLLVNAADTIQALQDRCGELERRNGELYEQRNQSHAAEREAHKRIAALGGALEFYGDPETYLAISFFPDPPCGDFMDDWSDTGPEYGMRPGKLARQALAPGGDAPAEQDALTDLVARFSAALLEKLKAAREKYSYDGELWMRDDWRDDLLKHMRHHVEKGDPRDVAAYCAFAWHHGWSIAPGGDGGEGEKPRVSVDGVAKGCTCEHRLGARVLERPDCPVHGQPHPTEPDRPEEEICDVCERPAHWTEVCTDPLCPNEKVRVGHRPTEPDRPNVAVHHHPDNDPSNPNVQAVVKAAVEQFAEPDRPEGECTCEYPPGWEDHFDTIWDRNCPQHGIEAQKRGQRYGPIHGIPQGKEKSDYERDIDEGRCPYCSREIGHAPGCQWRSGTITQGKEGE